jgi:TolA-binding protein
LALGVWGTPAWGAETLTQGEPAGVVLTTAKGAFNDGNYEAAAERFRGFIKLGGGGGRNEQAAARYGLGVCLIEGPAKDYKTAAEMLQVAAQAQGFKDRAYALYYLGVAYRNLDGAAVVKRRQGRTGMEAAAKQFGLAAEALAQLAPGNVSADKELPAEWEWVAKARCDQADALLRAGQFKQAATAASAVLEDEKLKRSRYVPQAEYDLGYASFALKDYATAVRSLSMLAPFDQGEIGVHAQYLLARTHHLAGERPEAMVGYEAMINSWQARVNEAQAKLADATTPAAEKARLEAFVKGPAPDYAARAMFYWGVVLEEFGKADDAMTKYMEAVRLGPGSAVAGEARIRAARSAVQVRKFKEALEMVTPLTADPKYGAEALRYVAKGEYGLGTVPVPKGKGDAAIMNAVADPAALAAGIKQAIATLQKADERAKATSVAAGEQAMILMDLGDMQQLDRQYKEAAATYARASSLGGAEMLEQGLERQAIALQLAGDFAGADKACGKFLSRFPKSDLRAEVSERYAENALLAAEADHDPAKASGDGAKRRFSEAVARLSRVVTQFPDTTQANLARMGLATVEYQQGHFKEAAELLGKIPESDRVDDLVSVSFMLADCALRALPDKAEDALTSARVAAELEKIITQLEGYAGSRPNDPEAPQALVRIGYAATKLGNLLADPVEKRRTLAKARRAYVAVLQQFPDHPLYPVALLENAKILASFGGGAAVMELSKFQVPPLDKTAIAPLAMIHLADAQRTRRHPEETIKILTLLKDRHEAELLKDPSRAGWVAAMDYSLGLAYKESGQFEQAAALFQKIAQDFADRPEGTEAVWRLAQCQTDPALAEVERRRRELQAAGRPQARQEAVAALGGAMKRLRAAAEHMAKGAEELAAKGAESDLPVKMNFDAAWCWRSVGDAEVELARRSLQAEALKKLAEKLAQEEPGRSIAKLRPPEIAIGQIPLQPGEKAAREKFKAVIDDGGESPLVDEAKLELAEQYAQRDEFGAAVDLLKELSTGDANPELAERVKLRLGTLELARGDAKSAAAVAAELLTSRRNAYQGYARVLATEAAYRQKDWAGAIEQAKPFVEGARGLGRVQGVTDHALLRMADAQGQLGQWKEARATLEMWFKRFNSGPLTPEAKFAYGWVCEHLNDPAKAIAAYAEVGARTGGELGAKANLQVGRLRLQQKQPAEALGSLLTVAYAYDDVELSPAAMCEAASALVQLNRPAEAKKLLERAVKDYPGGAWAATAKRQLAEIKQ